MKDEIRQLGFDFFDVLWAYKSNKLRYLTGSQVVLNLTISIVIFICCFAPGSTWRPQTPENTRFRESRTKVEKLYTQPPNATFFTLQNRSTFNLPTQGTMYLYRRRLYCKRVYAFICFLYKFFIFDCHRVSFPHFGCTNLQHSLLGSKILHCSLYITPK